MPQHDGVLHNGVLMDISIIERRWRRVWMRTITRRLPGPRSTTLPQATAERPLRVLYLRYEAIGDVIMATGVLRAIARSSPHITLDVVASPVSRGVLEHNPHVRKTFVLDRRARGGRAHLELGRALRRERYDVIVDGRINNPPAFTTTPLLMLLAGAPYRVGVRGGNNDDVYNVRVAPYDRSIHFIQASQPLVTPFGVDVDAVDWRPEIFLTDDERAAAEATWRRAADRLAGSDGEPRLLVNLSASESTRRWPDERFVEVLRAVRAERPALPIAVIGLPSEWASVQQVAGAVNAEPVPTPMLRQALALVAASDLVFTPDTSISHAAAAFARPAVVLLREEHVAYTPWQTPGEHVYWKGDVIRVLPVEEVRAAVLRLVSGEYAGMPAGPGVRGR